jgi:hypothetical protein
LATNFDFGSKLKQVVEEESKRIRAQEAKALGLSPLTPLASPTLSHYEGPQPALGRQQAQEEGLSPLTPLTSSTLSCEGPQPAPAVPPCFLPVIPNDDQLFGLTSPFKRPATGSPDVSPTPSPSKKPPNMDSSQKERRRENRRQLRRRRAATNPEQGGSGQTEYVYPSLEPGFKKTGAVVPESPVTGSRKKKRRRVNRKGRREREMAEPLTNPKQTEHGQKKHVKPSVPLKIETNFKEAKVASTGYTGLDDNIRTGTDVPLKGLLDGTHVGRKFDLQKWDGKYVFVFIQKRFYGDATRSSIPITDSEGLVFAILACMPKDDAWNGHMRDGAEALETARHDCDLDPEDAYHRRGNYLNLRTGVSMGGGQTCPTAANNSDRNNEILDRLNSMECFQNLAKFTTCELPVVPMEQPSSIFHSATFKTWAPKLHARYAVNLKAL